MGLFGSSNGKLTSKALAKKLKAYESLKGLDIRNLELSGLKFHGTELTEARLSGSTFAQCHFDGSTMNGTDISSTYLSNCKIEQFQILDKTNWNRRYIKNHNYQAPEARISAKV
jgi:uncharacterized protein YjbI with pentapeptide repeats